MLVIYEVGEKKTVNLITFIILELPPESVGFNVNIISNQFSSSFTDLFMIFRSKTRFFNVFLGNHSGIHCIYRDLS